MYYFFFFFFSDTNISINTTSSSKRDPYVDLELSDRIQSGFSALPSFSDCGIQYYQPDRIAGGGIVTSFDEFPWMALLQYSKSMIIDNTFLKKKIQQSGTNDGNI